MATAFNNRFNQDKNVEMKCIMRGELVHVDFQLPILPIQVDRILFWLAPNDSPILISKTLPQRYICQELRLHRKSVQGEHLLPGHPPQMTSVGNLFSWNVRRTTWLLITTSSSYASDLNQYDVLINSSTPSALPEYVTTNAGVCRVLMWSMRHIPYAVPLAEQDARVTPHLGVLHRTRTLRCVLLYHSPAFERLQRSKHQWLCMHT